MSDNVILFPGIRRLHPPHHPTPHSGGLLGGTPTADAARARMLAAIEQWSTLLQQRPRVAMKLLEIVERLLNNRVGR